jgi:hypothetical protein
VVYEKPPSEPWEAMPVGGGDLSAMVRCLGGSLVLHLTKSDAWGFQQTPDAPLGSRFFNNVSPGTVTIDLGDRAAALAARRFRQRLDLVRGRIVVELGEADEKLTLSIWGDPHETVLLVAWEDPKGWIPQATVALDQWRDSMRVWCEDERIGAVEIHTRPARPHLANTGMQDYFAEDKDPLQGRGTAVVIGARTATVDDRSSDGKTASMRVSFQGTEARLIAIACTVAPHSDPTPQAKATLETSLLDRCRKPSRGAMRGGTSGGASRRCKSPATIRWCNGCAEPITSTCTRSAVPIAGRCRANGMADRA